ncbi:MAG: tetratricopeptide repeat protein [Bacteroidota bacterium]
MRKFVPFWLFLTLHLSSLLAQTPLVDSLQAVVVQLPEDTNKVNALLELSIATLGNQPDSTIRVAQAASELAQQLNFQSGLAYAYKNIGLGYYVKGNFQEVESYWKKSLAIFRLMGDPLGTSNLLSNLGAVYFNQGDDPKALEYYLASLRAAEQLGNKLRIVTALSNIGAVYLNLRVNHDKALEYYSRALPLSEEIGEFNAIATTAVNMGEIYLERNQLDSAMVLFEKALESYKAAEGNPSYALTNIGKVYATQAQYEKAIDYQQQALAAAQRLDDRMQMTISANALAQSYLDFGQTDLSLRYFEQAFNGAQATDMKPERVKAAEGLYEIYKQRNDFDQALKYHEIYANLKDTLLNEESIKRSALLGAEYEFEKERKQIEYDSEAQIKRQRVLRNAITAGLIVALIFIGILVQYYRLKRISSTEKFEAQRQLIIQDKLASLGQITAGIAHEIKNPLNFVTNFAEGSVELGEELMEVVQENKEKLSQDQYELIEELATDISENAKIIEENGLRADRVVRRMMEQARGDKGEPQQIDINTLVDENIGLAYHGYRGNVPNFDVQIEKNYDESLPEIMVIPQDIGRVVLNMFNNACYALHEKQKKLGASFQPMIQVSTSQQKNHLVIKIRDNGPGISDKHKAKIFQPFYTTKPAGTGNTGLGLSISHDLIVIGHEGKLEVDTKKGEFTEFRIGLPIG